MTQMELPFANTPSMKICPDMHHHRQHVWESERKEVWCPGVDENTTLARQPCPSETAHDPHDYTPYGVAQRFHCPGVDAIVRREDEAYNHPQHYGGEDNPYETIKVLANWLTEEQMQGFTLGNAIKYVSRAGKKDPTKTVEDLKKARWYLDYEITRLDVLSSLRAHDIGG